LDGWRADNTIGSLQDSPRVKNLLWVLGPGFAALIGDVKVLDPDAEKSVLLLAYFLPCVVASLLVVAVWGVVIGVGRIFAERKGQAYGYSFGDAVGDYFFYGYRYYRSRADEARKNTNVEKKELLTIAVFLDVDLTITEDTIQRVYARELGLIDEFEKLEQQYQDRKIDANEFGLKLIPLFASKGFTEAKAKELSDKIKLKPWVDSLFTLQDRGVAIYFVSSGPNYYIKPLADDKGIPKEHRIFSEYKFGKDGIISDCDAIGDGQKIQFVNNHRSKYDITIGIGDNVQHDQFVSVCTIGMLTTAHPNYIHVPHFNAVFSLVDKLLKPKDS
jgi:phosphoserine phosphatase